MLQNNRESNFELLRIISMIMVLAIHANFFSTGELSIEDTQNYFIQSILRCFSHSLCVGAVNTFVLISGYFGIRYKNRGLANLLFQCLFFSIGIYIIAIILGYSNLNELNILSSIMCRKCDVTIYISRTNKMAYISI